jgi:hypothetical protein
MRTVRRIYVYAVAFLSLQAVLWSAIGLAQLIVGPQLLGGLAPERLASLLAILIVALPAYLIHWWLARRQTLADPEERASALRGVYHYGVLASTAIPIVTNALFALQFIFGRLLAHTAPDWVVSPERTLPELLVLIVLAGVVWAYAEREAAADRKLVAETGRRGELRRIYRFLMCAFGLALVAFGATSLIVLLLGSRPAGAEAWNYQAARSLAQVVVGAIVWILSWAQAQRSFASGGEEAGSSLRKAYLYLATLVGSLAVLVSAAQVLAYLLERLLGAPASGTPLLHQLARPIAVTVVGATLWAYHARVLAADAAASGVSSVGAGVRRLYHYLISALGLGASIAGALTLIFQLTQWGDIRFAEMRETLSLGLATLAVGAPVWLVAWGKMQSSALAAGKDGEEARHSLARRGYLYLTTFAGVIGLLVSAGALAKLLLDMILGATTETPFHDVLSAFLSGAIFGVVLAYHALAIRRDEQQERLAWTAALEGYAVALIGPEGWAAEVGAGLARTLPGASLTAYTPSQVGAALQNAGAVVLPASLLSTLPEADRLRLSGYGGLRVVLPGGQEGWAWVGAPEAGLVSQAQEAGRLIERSVLQQPLRSPWTVNPAGTVAAVILFLMLLPLAASLVLGLASMARID